MARGPKISRRGPRIPLIVAGIGLLTAFAYWQALNTREPLIPLEIFRDRDFSLCNIGVAITSFASTAMMLPLTFYTQTVCGLSPTRSALLIAPMAIANGVLAPFVGSAVPFVTFFVAILFRTAREHHPSMA